MPTISEVVSCTGFGFRWSECIRQTPRMLCPMLCFCDALCCWMHDIDGNDGTMLISIYVLACDAVICV